MQHFNNIETIETDDGSTTLYLPALNETYHSRRGAQTESEYIYIDRGIGAIDKKTLNVLEIGFGTGLNALLTLHYVESKGLTVSYDTYEAYPLPYEVVEALKFPVLEREHTYSEILKSMHLKVKTPLVISKKDYSFEFQLIHQRLEDANLPSRHYDVVYFDAFAPSKQADIWDIKNLQKIFDAIRPGGRMVTYCSQGDFKRNLRSIGFRTEHPEGPLGKKEMTIAIVPG